MSECYGIPCLRVEIYYHYILKGEKIIVTPTPEQLLSLIESAEYVISDSFHMSVFSIIFHKKFGAIYSKDAFNGRIISALKSKTENSFTFQ